MNGRFVLSVLGYFVATMIVAVLWHLVLFHDEYIAMGAFTRGEPIMGLGMTAVILQAFVFAYLFPIYLTHRGGEHPLLEGVKFSLLLGVCVWTVMVFATAAKFKIEPVWNFIAFGTAFQILQFVFVGLVLGFIHRDRTA